ncbi:MAG: hypothetical protein FJY82_07670 [Candidatus Aminicenantes bacterium]|nr:hypothetical protein [Candidatus Aminicenantes bacterium]
MKKKVGTIINESLLAGAKQRAALERRPLSVLIEDALNGYLEGESDRGEALRALAKFTSHGALLSPSEIDEILQEDMLSP